MKRFQVLVLVSAITAGAIWYGFYRSQHTSSVAVASLLPKETQALVHLPDFNRSRDEWHHTDLYQLWMEPTVQDFLVKPRSKIPDHASVSQTIDEIEKIGMKDVFVAVVSLEYSAWKIVGGFRCSGNGDEAEKIVHEWKIKFIGQGSDFKHETVEYQGRQIHTDSAGLANLSTVRSGQWFFVANDIEHLKPLLDRADGRVKDPQTAFSANDVFVAASKHMPSSYAALAFARVDQFIEKLAPAPERSPDSPGDRVTPLRQIRSFCAATSFDGGKIRDTLFVGMPKASDLGNLTRASMSVATKDTFLYAASVLNLTKEMELGLPVSTGWLSGLQQITGALSASGIALEEWRSAFGAEIGVIGDWPANSQWPSLFLTLPVKDSAKAIKIVTAITTANPDGPSWTHEAKEGFHYFFSPSSGQLFSLSPTIGLSDRTIVAGAQTDSVEAALKRSTTGSSGLAASKKFQDAERTVPGPQEGFAYLDPALIYARLDTNLRPVLVMGAAVMPGVADNVDLGKLPPAEIITKHLSPMVMSQRYDRDGYVAESIGPVPLYQALLGSVIARTAVTGFTQSHRLDPQPSPSNLAPTPALRPPSSPSPNPNEP